MTEEAASNPCETFSSLAEDVPEKNNSRPSSKRKPGDFGFMNFMKSDPRFKKFCPLKPEKVSNSQCPEGGNHEDDEGPNQVGAINDESGEKHFIAIQDNCMETEDNCEEPPPLPPHKITPTLIASGVNVNGDVTSPQGVGDVQHSASSDEETVPKVNNVSSHQSRQLRLSKNERILHQFLYGESTGPEEDGRADSDDSAKRLPKENNGDTIEEGEVEREDDDGDTECSLSVANDSGSTVQTNRREMEFDVLDDLNEDDDDEDESSYNDYWEDSDNADEVPEDEIDAMLDQKLEEYRKLRRDRYEDEEQAHEEREKVVLKARGNDHFEVLPEGWIEVTHNSGMPIYLHKPTRVCTLSKPYFLGPGSARKHQVPITAVPCLHYRRELGKEREQEVKGSAETEDGAENEVTENASQEGSVPKAGQSLPSAKIETVQENFKEKSIDHIELREYCQSLFEFKTITVRRFKTWAGRRKHQQRIKQMHRPTLPSGTKLITCPLPPSNDRDDNGNSNPRRAEFVMNPNGKSHVCILHEYVQHAMKVQPRYTFKELENASTPYGATVVINDMEYGSGFGSSKKYAKLHAAKATLEILIPQMKNINPDDKAQGIQQDLSFFDEVRVVDPRVSELCAKAGQPSPYQILLECLKRNYGMGDTQIKFETQTLKHQKNEFTMTVGKHVAKVICKNKRDGKQRASQSILQAMHPHIPSWGSLLRLYGKGSCKTLKEKKQEEQQITELQCRTTANKPNQLILDKLRDELLKLKRNKELMKPIGKFVSTDIEPPSLSGCNLKNVDL